VRLFVAAAEFGADLLVDGVLCVDETLEFGKLEFICWNVRASQR
jgi:hypothetical protein